jgi:hypothetical protein
MNHLILGGTIVVLGVICIVVLIKLVTFTYNPRERENYDGNE